MFEDDVPSPQPAGGRGVWLDLHSKREGVFLGRFPGRGDFAFKLEKHPKEVPNAPRHAYPLGMPRWLRVSAVHASQLKPGRKWKSPPVIIMPHAGDWHAGADRYAAHRHTHLVIAPTPAWMDNFVGWSEIMGKTYLGEVFYDYAGCAKAVAAGQPRDRAGLRVLLRPLAAGGGGRRLRPLAGSGPWRAGRLRPHARHAASAWRPRHAARPPTPLDQPGPARVPPPAA